MKERHVLTELKDIVSGDHAALVVWDVQNMLVNRIFNKDSFIATLEKLIEGARKAGTPIFFTRITPLPEQFESSVRLALRRNFSQMPTDALDLYIKPR
ncbi:isochorismatase hydrolase, partial [mine drainage metagenome]